MQTQILKVNFLAALLLTIAFVSCKKDDTTEQELITTVQLRLTATDSGLEQIFEWDDRDGDGGTAPVIDEIVLSAGKIYTCTVHFYDRSKTPEEDITAEVEAENTEHLVVFGTSGANLTVADGDVDDNGKPLRLRTIWTTSPVSPSTGTVKVTLRHEPDKNAANPDTTGEVDAEAEFVVKVQ